MDAVERKPFFAWLDGDQGRPGQGISGLADGLGQTRHGRIFEERDQAELFAKFAFDGREEPYREQRMAAELKEIVVDSQGGDAQDFPPDLDEPVFDHLARHLRRSFPRKGE